MRLQLRGKSVVALAAAVMVSGLATTAHASPGWTVDYLPLPAEYPAATGFVTGTDGKGGYSGELGIGDQSRIATWTEGKVVVHDNPAGYEFLSSSGQNSSSTVTGTAIDYDTPNDHRVFTLDNGVFRLLPSPGGSTAWATAINDRGDVLGAMSEARASFVLWPGDDPDNPVVVDPGLGDVNAVDIDDDGTVLLNSSERIYLWKAGTLRALPVPAGFAAAYGSAIENGRVVGFAPSLTGPGSQALLWPTPDAPQKLPGGDTARVLNSSGLIAGREPVPDSPNGPLTTWQGTWSQGRLPIPAGETNGAVGAVGDDGTIVGYVSDRPLDEGGRPVVWKRSA